MNAVRRHLTRNAGKPLTSLLPARTCFGKCGEAARLPPRARPYSKGMEGITVRHQPERTAGIYWRRRIAVLVIGLSVFAVASWGLSSVLKVPAGATGPAGTRPAHQGRPGAGKPAPAGRPSPGPQHSPQVNQKSASGDSGRRQGSGKGAVSRSSPLHTARTGVAPSPGASARPSGPFTFTPAFCARPDVVLSVFVPQATFGRGQTPSFSLNVVSTGQATCSFNVGPGRLALVIREGPVRIWSSADCVRGSGSLITALRRGVPTVLAISWNRQTSAPGCTGRARRVPPGIYTAYGVEGGLVSTPVTFRLV